jgi:hypothetical protein
MVVSKVPAFSFTAVVILVAAVVRALDDETTTRLPMGAVAHATAVLLATAVAWPVNDERRAALGALARATEVLERATQGQVLEIRMVDETGDPGFEAAVARDDKVLYLRIEPSTDVAKAIVVRELPAWLMNYGMQAHLRDPAHAEVPLAEAILKAEHSTRAPAIGAGIARPLRPDNAVRAYYVETSGDRARQLLAVDAKTGGTVANPDSIYEPWMPVKLCVVRSATDPDALVPFTWSLLCHA